jgi:hypothetical protein
MMPFFVLPPTFSNYFLANFQERKSQPPDSFTPKLVSFVYPVSCGMCPALCFRPAKRKLAVFPMQIGGAPFG